MIAPTEQRETNNVKWLCKCVCGNETVVRVYDLMSGHTQSCGCLQKEKVGERSKKYNVFEIKGDVSIGYTKSGIAFLIDTEELDKVSKYCWYINAQGYITSRIGNKIVSLHRFILNINDDRIIDHKNRIKTDNRKTNLRVATNQQNNMNRGINRNSTTGVKGVSKSKNEKKYIAYIYKDGRHIHIGTYDTLKEARQARIQKEVELFGEFAFQEEEGGGLK